MAQTRIYTSGDTLPEDMMEENFFHSPQLFALCQQTPRHRPYMVTLVDDDGCLMAQMLAVVRYRSSWFPPYYYMHCRIMGEGVYKESSGEAFEQMLNALTAKLGPRMLYVEVSHLSHKMFGYRQLRAARYFPVRWMSIHNSLHSRTPEERITSSLQQRIDNAYERGVITDEVKSEGDFKDFMKLLRHHNWLKPKRYIPADEFFRFFFTSGLGDSSFSRLGDSPISPNDQTTKRPNDQTTKQPNNQTTKQPNNQTTIQPNNQTTKQPNNQTTKQPNNQTTKQPNNQTTEQPNNQTTKQPNNQTTKQPNNQTTKQPNDQTTKRPNDLRENGRLFLTRYHNRVVGCSAVVYSNHQAYLWYAAYRRKSFAWVHPRELTIWHAIKDAHSRGYEHIFFMDVGLPFRKNKFRDFILRFGGKPVSTYRWFRCSIKWINSLLSWIYRD